MQPESERKAAWDASAAWDAARQKAIAGHRAIVEAMVAAGAKVERDGYRVNGATVGLTVNAQRDRYADKPTGKIDIRWQGPDRKVVVHVNQVHAPYLAPRIVAAADAIAANMEEARVRHAAGVARLASRQEVWASIGGLKSGDNPLPLGGVYLGSQGVTIDCPEMPTERYRLMLLAVAACMGHAEAARKLAGLPLGEILTGEAVSNA